MENTKPNKYEVRSLEALCDLANPENIERLAEDVKGWLINYVHTIEMLRALGGELVEGKKNTEIAMGGFTWIDDGKNEIHSILVEAKKEEQP